MTYADTQAASIEGAATGLKVWQEMQVKVDGNLMPPAYPIGTYTPNPLTAAEKATLDAWFSHGAPGPGTQTCP